MSNSRSARKTGSSTSTSLTRRKTTISLCAALPGGARSIVGAVPQDALGLAILQFPVVVTLRVLPGLYAAIGLVVACGLWLASERRRISSAAEFAADVGSVLLIAAAWPLVTAYLAVVLLSGTITARKEPIND